MMFIIIDNALEYGREWFFVFYKINSIRLSILLVHLLLSIIPLSDWAYIYARIFAVVCCNGKTKRYSPHIESESAIFNRYPTTTDSPSLSLQQPSSLPLNNCLHVHMHQTKGPFCNCSSHVREFSTALCRMALLTDPLPIFKCQ